MKLGQLIQAQSCGAFKVEADNNTGRLVVGGVEITPEQSMIMAQAIGWVEYAKKPWEVIDKANKFIRGIKGQISNADLLETTEVTFQNFRRQNTEKYYDRIKLVGPLLDITILYGMTGLGAYAVFDGTNNFKQPVFSCRTTKMLGEYINESV